MKPATITNVAAAKKSCAFGSCAPEKYEIRSKTAAST